MINIAHVIIDGNLTRDPEMKTTSNGKTVASFSIAVNHKDDETSYFDIQCWDKVATNVSEYLRKGSKVTILGTLKQQRWKTDGGENRSKVIINASSVRFDSKPKDQSDPKPNASGYDAPNYDEDEPF